eukprot:scaffold101368_cov63-Phaeocystis_antarctica.AAC.3
MQSPSCPRAQHLLGRPPGRTWRATVPLGINLGLLAQAGVPRIVSLACAICTSPIADGAQGGASGALPQLLRGCHSGQALACCRVEEMVSHAAAMRLPRSVRTVGGENGLPSRHLVRGRAR